MMFFFLDPSPPPPSTSPGRATCVFGSRETGPVFFCVPRSGRSSFHPARMIPFLRSDLSSRGIDYRTRTTPPSPNTTFGAFRIFGVAFLPSYFSGDSSPLLVAQDQIRAMRRSIFRRLLFGPRQFSFFCSILPFFPSHPPILPFPLLRGNLRFPTGHIPGYFGYSPGPAAGFRLA